MAEFTGYTRGLLLGTASDKGREDKQQPEVRKVKTVQELGTAMNNPGVEAAYYEAPKRKDGADFLALNTFYRLQGLRHAPNLKSPSNSIHTYIEEQKNLVRTNTTPSRRDTGSPEAACRALDAIEQSLVDIVNMFPAYQITFFFTKGDDPVKHPYKQSREQNWEIDDLRSDGDMTVVRTFLGNSTQYAKNKKGDGMVTPKPNSITAHRNGADGAVHRSPDDSPEGRFALVVRLTRKENIQ